MSVPVCDWCTAWIDSDNRRHPGYCSVWCRNSYQYERDQALAAQARSRADARRHREANRRRWAS